ncbi:MAG: zinc-binding dehydrogenase [Ilumatobacteraceae bacterium]
MNRRFDLKDAPDAFRYLELGHARGKIIITP